MDEFSFIDSIKQKYYRQPTLLRGVGDDAAVFRQQNRDIVTSVDTMVENVHFSKHTMSLFHAGYRALAANISDLAAMGATPAFYLTSIVIPSDLKAESVTRIFSGMDYLASMYQMDLIGGDTVSGSELSISITVIGYTDSGKARYRSSAREGDVIFVTGSLGDSQAGFHILTNKGEYVEEDYFIRRHRMPSPRAEFAAELQGVRRVSLNDISDGLASELNEIAEASQLTMVVKETALPVSTHYSQFPTQLQYKWKLYGGEDFELVGTVAKEDWESVREAAENTNTPITRIGYVARPQSSHVYLETANGKTPLYKEGYTHLK
ncbi:thiamine-phosphate kinase [Virgibacillus xinjiangensis]|uniref:Thiamine-monophosphate kinase n=1 Tax=Virgibacillus xinjiangensis TaxID=393090 RepID=A0ABV7CZA0_9BACI